MIKDKNLSELSVVVGRELLRLGATVTTAESCTGGWIAKVLTDISGSSQWFEQGFITYSNEAKQKLVDVRAESLASFGAVSERVVTEMAEGALRNANADYAISVSGIAGPDGGSAEKPVGTVWFGLAVKGGTTRCYLHHFEGDRDAVRHQATARALTLLRDHFLEN